MKKFLLAVIFLSSFSVNAQTDEGLFEVEYEMNGQDLKSFAFSTENCPDNVIVKTWENWVNSKEGTTSFFKKNEASNLKFKNSDDTYKSIISIVQEENEKTTIINTLTDQNGMSFNQESYEFNSIYNYLKDLSVKTKQACVRNELRLANDNLIRLTKDNASAQQKKGSSIKSYLKNSNTLLKVENKKQNLEDKLDLLTNQLEKSSDDKTTDNLMKKKQNVENSLKSIDNQIMSLNTTIQQAEVNDEGLNAKINQLSIQIKDQRTRTENLKKKYSSIN